ncbi:MAG: sulfatase-like hydrolase/transferase [Candidatus Izemoplasma sp.]|nr:sulfatase-like hydrolase/transferase [Candidatus Izemoplasma sp.]
MKKSNYKMLLIIIGYLFFLRGILMITTGMSIFHLGVIFDLVLVTFWIGAIGFFIRSLTGQKIFYITVILIATVFVISDSIYYDYFDTISAVKSLDGLKWLKEGTTLEYNIQIPLVTVYVIPVFIGLIVYIIKKMQQPDHYRLNHLAIISIIFVIQIGLYLSWTTGEYENRLEYYQSDAYLFASMHDRVLYSEKYGYYHYHLLDITKLNPDVDAIDVMDEAEDYFDSRDHHLNEYSDQYNGYNLITILGESLDTRFIDPTLTPNLYKMYSEGMRFDNYYTPVFQQGATCNSEYMSLVGLSAINTNDWSNNICDTYSTNAFPYSLPNQLQTIGYDTYYFHSGHEWFYNRSTIIPHYGFETVKFQEDLYRDGYNDFNEHFDSQMTYFFDEYVSYDNPFHINLLTYSGHGAYNQEAFNIHLDQLNQAYPNTTFDSQVENYMLKLIETDKMIGDIMNLLESKGELDNTLFAVFPDHYPYMMEEETYQSFLDLEEDSKEIHHQTLLIYATGMQGETFDVTGSTIDIPPTLLNLLDSSLNFNYFMGHDLLSVNNNYVLFNDLSITDGKNVLYLDGTYIGDISQKDHLETVLAEKIKLFEIQQGLLNIDYFKTLN